MKRERKSASLGRTLCQWYSTGVSFLKEPTQLSSYQHTNVGDKPAYLDAITVICFSINLEISMRTMILFLHLSSCTTWLLCVTFQESYSKEHSPIPSNSHVVISMAESTFQDRQLVAVASHPREVMWWGTWRLSHLRQLAMMTQHTGTGTVAAWWNRKDHGWHPGDTLYYWVAFPCPPAPHGTIEQTLRPV